MSSSDRLSFMIALDDGLAVLRAGSIVTDEAVQGLSARIVRAIRSGILDDYRLSFIARRHAREMLISRVGASSLATR